VLFANRRLVALLALRRDPQQFIRQRALQLYSFLKRTIEPSAPFLFGCQDYRHGLGMDGRTASFESVVRNAKRTLRRLSVHAILL
jgi:hypothetical protein